ncbi:hypothetical protein BJV78DRAFT_1375749 [Lactifluus subvellereus]|nr:hypothetical protein BJV78DRAFT_1375749 [Lactifluus subvellereus]
MSAIDGVHGTLCNAQQYQQSLPLPNNSSPSISCLTHGQTIGLALTAEASFLSLASVIVVFSLIGRNIHRYRKVLPNGDWKLLNVPADVYMLSLFLFDALQALGGILDVRWAHTGIVTTGTYCTAQGIVQQTGELGAALITFILAIHTFVTALWRVGIQARGFAFGLVGLACVFTALWVGLGNGLHKNYEAPTPFWCWISSHYGPERLAGEYLWLWLALFASVIMYIPVYFWAEGRLSVDPEKWYNYPLAYSLAVLPVSIARWSQFSHKSVSSAATFFGVSMHNLSGIVNVLLFLAVRPQLLLFTPPEETIDPEIELARHSIRSAIPPDTTAYNHSPQATGKGLVNDSGKPSRNSATLSRVSSRSRSVYNDI